MREEALANHVALPHPAGPDGRRMRAIAMSFGIFKNSKDPEAAMSLIAHLLSPEETVRVMKDSYGQFAPVLDKARAASKDYFNKNENYRTFGRAAEWFSPTGWPGPVTAAAAEVQASNVLTDAPAKVIVDKWSRRSGDRVGGQEDQGNLRHPARVTWPSISSGSPAAGRAPPGERARRDAAPPCSCCCRCSCSSSA